MGDLFRQQVQARTALGRRAQDYVSRAELVPDAIVEAMVTEWAEAVPPGEGLLFDGFPRTPDQVRFFEELLGSLQRELRAVIYLTASDETIASRLAGRQICDRCQALYHTVSCPPRIAGRCDRCGGELHARPDDAAELARRRVQLFHRTIEPVLKHYAAADKLVIVSGEGPVVTVVEALSAALKNVRDGTIDWAPPQVATLAPPRPLLAAPVVSLTSFDFVLLGGPGSGKGTQAERLGGALRLPHLATGDLFREHLRQATRLGRMARASMDRGELLPDQVTDDGGRAAGPARHPRWFHPRRISPHLPQAHALDNILARQNRRLAGVLYINVSDETIIRRLSGRMICGHCRVVYHREFNPPRIAGSCDRCGGQLHTRADDKLETVAVRLTTHHRQTAAVVAFYRTASLLHEVSGEGSVTDIAAHILAIVDPIRRGCETAAQADPPPPTVKPAGVGPRDRRA